MVGGLFFHPHRLLWYIPGTVMGFLDIADPIVTLTLVIVLLFVLWVLQRQTRALRLLRHQLQTLERGQAQLDEEMEILGQSRDLSAASDSGAQLAAQRSSEEDILSGPQAAIRKTIKSGPRLAVSDISVSESQDLLDEALAELD